VFAWVDGAVVMHRAVLHIIIRIKTMIILFKGITTVGREMRDTCVEKPLFSKEFRLTLRKYQELSLPPSIISMIIHTIILLQLPLIPTV